VDVLLFPTERSSVVTRVTTCRARTILGRHGESCQVQAPATDALAVVHLIFIGE